MVWVIIGVVPYCWIGGRIPRSGLLIELDGEVVVGCRCRSAAGHHQGDVIAVAPKSGRSYKPEICRRAVAGP